MKPALRTIEQLAWLAGLVGTPLVMLLGYQGFAHAAAARFRILDVAGDYLAGVLAAVLLLLAVALWPVPARHRRIIAILWVLRVGVALGVMLPYEAHYGLDANMYYNVGISLSDPWALMSFGNGTDSIRALVGVLSGITLSYSAMKVIFSYVGLVAVYVFYRAATLALGRDEPLLLYALGLFPSLLFWSSILGKDPPVLLGIAIFSYGAVGLVARQRFHMLVWVVLGLLIASWIRIWLGAIFVTALALSYVMSSRATAVAKGAFALLVLPLFLVALRAFAERFSISTTQDLVTTADVLSQAWAHGGSAQVIKSGFDSLGTMLLFMPIGAFTALFRPLPFEVMNVFGMLAGLENALLLGMLLAGLRRWGLRWLAEPVLLWAAVTVTTWAAAYGFVSYQNLGSAFRFRAQVVAILLMLVLALAFGGRQRTAAEEGAPPGARSVPP